MRLGCCPNHPAVLRDKRILIVEDDAVIAMMIEDELLEAGVRVVGPAGSIDDALRLIETMKVDDGLDAAVLDINLDGEVVSPVADQLAALGVPFLFATGCDTGVIVSGQEIAPVLHKPFNAHALLVALKALPLGARLTQSHEGAAISP